LRATTITPPRSVAEKERVDEPSRESDRTSLVDDTLEGSFPASDPPSWTASVARLSPAAGSSCHACDTTSSPRSTNLS
jgi:hypothetical protein